MIPAMSNQNLDTLNKAYYFGEYDLKEYRDLRSKLIDDLTQANDNPTQPIAESKSLPTLKISSTEKKSAPSETDQTSNKGTHSGPGSSVNSSSNKSSDKNNSQKNLHRNSHKQTSKSNSEVSAVSSSEDERAHRGPSALQFLWVSIAIILFIYMYTATIE